MSFRAAVLPVLTKSGCNAGACHGAATGQGGFKLSLLGYDPQEDYARITRELGARRIDRDQPERSLILLKPSRQLGHEGGRRLPRGSKAYATLLEWIRNGAGYGPPDLRVSRVTVEPEDLLLAPDGSAELRVWAELSDGAVQDATALALYSSNDEAMAAVDSDGRVTVRGRGRTSIMVRYGGQVAAARITVPFGGEEPGPFPARNFIDEHIGAELEQLRLPASPLSSAGEFFRRVHLDLAGRLPSPEAARAFSRDADTPAARDRLVGELLAGDAFVSLWTMHWADLLLIAGKRGGEEAAAAYHRWLRTQVAQRVPFDQVVRSLLTAQGNPREVPPVNYFSLAADPRDLAEQTSRIFLGTQLACARCHAHPADRWTQDDYYGFAAHFARVTRERDVIRVSARGELDHPKSGRPVAPRPLGWLGPVDEEGDRRVGLARWMTDPVNPMMARAVANRVWKHLFGRGLVEPVDDLRPTNPATHPALLEALSAEFIASGYDVRHLIRVMVSSRAYQLSSSTLPGNRLDDRFYSHAYLKELPAPVYLDAVAQVTGVPERFAGYDPGIRAVDLIGAQTPSYALDVLGRCPREVTCDAQGRFGGGMALALHLINGPTLNDKVRDGIVRDLCGGGKAEREIVEELYWRALSRSPRPAEWTAWQQLRGAAPALNEAVEDLLWALLNTREFAANH